MGIKGILGFCECKGCRKRMEYEMDIISYRSDGSKNIKTTRICGKHAAEQLSKANIKSVTFENTMHFN